MNTIFMNLKMSTKLLIVPLIIILFLIISGIISYFGLSDQKYAINDIYNGRFKSYQAAASSLTGILRIHSQIYKTMSLRQSGFISAETLESLKKQLLSTVEQTSNGLQKSLAAPATSKEEKEIYQDCIAKLNDFKNSGIVLLETMSTDMGGAAMMITVADGKYNVLEKSLFNLLELEDKLSNQRYDYSLKSSNRVTTIYCAVVVIAVVVSVGLSIFITNIIVSPLKKSATAIDKIAHGDLSCDDLIIKSTDEVGILAEAFNKMTDNLSRIISGISEAAAGNNSFAGELSAAVERQGTISAEQSAAVSEITSTMEEFSASSTQIADHANSVVDIASKTWENTKRGAEAVETVLKKMNEINSDSSNSIHEIVELGRKSKEITKVMEIINTIADQTKLIAFNAALEASSAGEAGKRFGVVAVEIRRLADSVMESTGEIESKINEIQEAINRLVIASEKGSKGIQEGMEYSSQTAGILSGIVDDAQGTTNAAKQISMSIQQQKTASNQVVVALREIMSGTEQTSESVSRIHSISKDLTGLSDNLRELVEKFKLRDVGKT